jgi:hypothetical protein
MEEKESDGTLFVPLNFSFPSPYRTKSHMPLSRKYVCATSRESEEKMEKKGGKRERRQKCELPVKFSRRLGCASLSSSHPSSSPPPPAADRAFVVAPVILGRASRGAAKATFF